MVRASCGRRNSLRERIIGAGLKGARDKPSTTLVEQGGQTPHASRGPAQMCSTAVRPPVHATSSRTHPAPCA